MVNIVSLTPDNFDDFIKLLELRGDAPRDYYRWKYLDQPGKNPTGFIAYSDHEPVGCIGVMNRIYLDENGGECAATWFADWFVHKGVRSKGVGKMLLEKVRDISVHGFGIPGPPKAQHIAGLAGYGAADPYYDHLLLVRPYVYGAGKYASDGWVKSRLRGMFYYLRYARAGKRDKVRYRYEVLLPEEFARRVSGQSSRQRQSFIVTDEFIEWFASMPELPNGKKRYWHFSDTDTGHSFFGFSEPDSRKLMRATLLYYTCSFEDDRMLAELVWRLREDHIDYIHIFSRNLTDRLNMRFFVFNKVPLMTLNSHSLNTFSLDRENIWYSQQKMKII